MSGSAQQIQYVVHQNVIPPLWFVQKTTNFSSIFFLIFLSNLLQQQDPQILQVCLDALHNILKQTSEENLEVVTMKIEECGGLDKIEHLQTHANREIYQQSYDIMEKFFSHETVSEINE
jgi:hypothetical protein